MKYTGRYYKGKRIRANIYTKGKFGSHLRETLDTENCYLYSGGRYLTKITADDLPDDYIEIHSRVIWYMRGYMRTSGISDMKYTWAKENHLFKDDYIYISYHGSLKEVTKCGGFKDYDDYDVCICGNDIVKIVLAAEKFSDFNTSEVRTEIEKKRVWLRDNEPEYYYKVAQLADRDIFEQWKDKRYI